MGERGINSSQRLAVSSQQRREDILKDFTTIKAWQKAHLLALEVYRVTGSFPREEMYGLTSQMRRACVSIPSNIAEGCGRAGDTELARFLSIALGSASELQYQLLLARDLHFISDDVYLHLTASSVEVKKMLSSFVRRLRAVR